MKMDINYINSLLKKGKTVKDVRVTLGLSEKKFLRQIKELGYKYDQRQKLYIQVIEPVVETFQNVEIKDLVTTTNSTTKQPTVTTTLTTTQTTTIDYLTENIGLIKQLLNNYKRNTEHTNKTDIIINLVSDKHLNPKPKSIRINEFVWRDWLEATKDLTFSKSDLISQALKEFMERHDLLNE